MRIVQNKTSKYVQSWAEGDKAESLFVRVAKDKGWNVTPATREQNIYEHWDYLLSNGQGQIKVDVKAAKRLNRADLNTQHEWLWVEIQGITGHKGWLYGHANYICFQWFDTFWMVKRKDLVKKVEELVEWEYVTQKHEAYYRLYQRKGRKDLISLIRYSDIEDIATKYKI